MRVIELRAENVKRLKAVQIRPGNEPVVEISGRNGQGKTSVLDALFWALAGARSAQDRPIRDGEDSARVTLDLGEIVVTRKFRQQDGGKVTTSLVVESEEGARFRSPQKMLDELVGSLSFDPLAFTRASPREQYETLAAFVADLDVDEFEREQKADYDRRAVANREHKRLQAAADSEHVPDNAPAEPVSVEKLTTELREAEAANKERDRLAREMKSYADGIDSHREELKRERAQLDELKRRALAIKANMDQRERTIAETEAKIEAFPGLPEYVDTEAIYDRLDTAAELNAAGEARDRRDELMSQAKAAAERAHVIDNRMNERKRAFEAAVASADMPVAGLALVDGAVELHGIPLSQASDAEQLRLSCACAMRQNAELRVLRVRDGSLLDSDSMEVLRALAADLDYQVWVERVADTGDGMGFVITDGEVAETPDGSV